MSFSVSVVGSSHNCFLIVFIALVYIISSLYLVNFSLLGL